MKLRKRIAAVAAAMVMAVSTMATSASALDNTTSYSSHGHLKIVLATYVITYDYASTTATNTNGSGKLIICQSDIYRRVGSSIDITKDTLLTQKSSSGTGSSVYSGQASVKADSSETRYGRGSAQMYNSGVTMSGTCCSASATCYYV